MMGRPPTSVNLSASPLRTRLTRREVHRVAVAAISGTMSASRGVGDTLAANDATFELPVQSDRRDSRIEEVRLPQITLADSMTTDPLDLPIEKIGYNPAYSKWEARNRLGVAATNALLRAHALSQQYIEDQDPSQLVQLVGSGKMPAEPDWDVYLDRLASDEDLGFAVMALPVDAPAELGNVQWMGADLRQGVTFHFGTDEGLFNTLRDIDGYSLRVDDARRLTIDVRWDNALLHEAAPNDQVLYDQTFSLALVHALAILSTSLGIVLNGEIKVFDKYVMNAKWRLIAAAALFPEQTQLLLGTPQSDGLFDSALLSVHLLT